MEQWTAAGNYFETCNCETACPCVFLSPPTTGKCTVLIAWHIDAGRFGAIPLDGLNVALAVDSPGPMTQVKWSAALYLDSRATPEQRDALMRVFSGQAGGHPAVLASFVGQLLGLRVRRSTTRHQARNGTSKLPGSRRRRSKRFSHPMRQTQ
jgi:hypothetical protein